MLRRRPVLRWIAAFLCICFAAGPSGCVGGDLRATDYHGRVRIGMSQGEVRDALGEGKVSSEGGEEVWHYAYKSVPHPGKITVETLKVLASIAFVIGALAALVYSRGNVTPSWVGCESWEGWKISRVETGTWHFRVCFDGERRVKSVSGVDLCEDR